jgi:hypothetical protein
MSVKSFFSLWSVTALMAAVFYLSGNFTLLTGVVFGFVSFGLTFMGMMSVLPAAVHDEPVLNFQAEGASLAPKRGSRIVETLHSFKAAWNPSAVEIRRPDFH